MHAILRTFSSYLQTRIFRFFESDCFGDEWLLLGDHRTAQRSDAAGDPQAAAGASRPAAGDGAPCPPRAWGSRWQFTACLPGAYTQSILVAFLTLCACVLLPVAAVSGTLCGSRMIAPPSMRRARQKPRRSRVGEIGRLQRPGCACTPCSLFGFKTRPW